MTEETAGETAASPARGGKAGELPPLVSELMARITALKCSHDRLEDRLTGVVEELEQARSALAQMESQTSEGLALLAHELRGPLTPLLHGTQLILSASERSVQAEARRVVQKQVRRMAGLIEDLLDTSRVCTGAVSLDVCDVDLKDMLEAAAQAAQPTFEAAGVHLSVSLPHEPLVVSADIRRVSQIVSNLLDNAVVFTDAGGEVELAAHREAEQAIATVSDTGIGITAQALPHIFDVFTRDSARSGGKRGLGMGLALARKLTELHGGQIRAESAGPGRGSRFEVSLPLLPRPRNRARQTNPSRMPRALSDDPRLRIVVVDDSRDSATAIGRLLQLLGHEVHLAFDGHEGLETCRRVRPDAAILDLSMHGLDGYQVAQELRLQADTRDALLVALTGLGRDSDRSRALASGFDHHMVKPADPSVLRQLLAHHRDRLHHFKSLT